MIIKRVSIQGFKTFAKRTDFIFDPGVTAIVGPNGSGKSNVVDAIRWCLGEQSFSLLRSKKTSDVIFSGSDQKARLGMAQVSLVLDNSQGELPVDFAEVEITRRAYRDGDNEYLLNGRRVRLQDITELLAQTGLGKRTYALIGQGLIDRILSLAPEELRSLFEEAAGITGYQNKRTTTIRRLDAAHQNLTRVQDIIAEISPRLGYLKRQADRAREREQLATDLHSLLLEWYGYHWHRTIQELADKHAAMQDWKQQVVAAQKALESTGSAITGLRARQSELRDQVGGLHHQSSDLHRQAETLSKELAVAQERMRQIQARRESAQQELAPLRFQIETLEERLRETASELEKWQATCQERRAAVEALQGKLDERRQARERFQTDLAQARRALAQVQSAMAELQSRLRRAEERKIEIQEEIATQRAARQRATTEADTLAQTLEKQESTRSDRTQEIDAITLRLEEIAQHIQARRVALDEAQQQRRVADREVDRLQTRHELLARLHREGAGYASGVRAVIQASAEGKDGLRGILGAVGSLLNVPAHLDKAIETALGGAMQNIVTQSWNDTQSAIEWLKHNRHGRATFLPLDRLNTLPAISAPNQPGILGNAADLVDYDDAVDDAVQQLLNRVWVAENLPAARNALDRIRSGPRPTVVTLEGEIIRPGGAVTGGSDRERRDDSILARERELRALPPQIEQANQVARRLTQECNAIALEIEQTAAQVQPLQEELEHKRTIDREEQSRLEEIRRELDRANQTAEWHSRREGELTGEADPLEARRHEWTNELSALEEQDRSHTRQLAEAETQAQQTESDQLLQQMAELRAAAAEADTTYQNKRALQESQQRNLDSVRTQIDAKTRQIEGLSTEADSLTAQIHTLDQREDQLNRAISALQVELSPAEQQLSVWEAEQARLEQRERSEQDTLRKAESNANTAHLQYQRTDDRIEQLRRNIEHDIGLVTLETSEDLAYQPPLPWEAIVEKLPVVKELAENAETDVQEMRARLSRITNVNPDAPREYAEAVGRHEHLLTQSADLEAAIADLRKVIRELDDVMETELSKTFSAVSEQFVYFFQQLFRGGSARLVLAEPEDITNSGIEIIARPPGKRPQTLALLSGGERTLTACALIFAILRVSPTPFCVLDEVDAALDEANVDRFRHTLSELSRDTQFIVITHNRRTLEGTNAIYGITMASDGTSRVISLRLHGEKIVQAEVEQGKSGNGTGDSDDQIDQIEELVKM